MNLAPDEMQIEIGETARGFLADRFPITRVRKLAEGGQAIDEEGWSACAEMGWLSMLVPEAEDGLGLGTAEAVMVFREIGRHLTPGPLRSTMLAALLAALVGLEDHEQRARAGHSEVILNSNGDGWSRRIARWSAIVVTNEQLFAIG